MDRDRPGRQHAGDRRRRTDGRVLRRRPAGAHRRGRRGVRNRTRDVQPGWQDARRRDLRRRHRFGRRRDLNRARIAFQRRPPSTRSRSTPAAASSSPRSTTRGLREFLVRPRPGHARADGSKRSPCRGVIERRFPEISRPLSMFAMAFAPDGSGLVTTRKYGPTLLWGPGLTTVRRYAIGGQSVAVSPDGGIAALIENSDDHPHNQGNVSFLNLRSGRHPDRVGRASRAV